MNLAQSDQSALLDLLLLLIVRLQKEMESTSQTPIKLLALLVLLASIVTPQRLPSHVSQVNSATERLQLAQNALLALTCLMRVQGMSQTVYLARKATSALRQVLMKLPSL